MLHGLSKCFETMTSMITLKKTDTVDCRPEHASLALLLVVELPLALSELTVGPVACFNL